MKKALYIAASLMALAIPVKIQAQQTLRSAYFNDGYTYRFKMNPAIPNDLNYLSIPILANANIETKSNVAPSNFLYPAGDGTLNTFMSSKVSTEEFLSNIKDMNRLGAGINMSIISAGFHTKDTYHTLDFSIRGSADINLAGDFLRFMKTSSNGIAVNNMFQRAEAYGELSYGISSQISDRVRLGLRFKALFGLGRAEININDATISQSDNKEWSVSADADMMIAGIVKVGTEEGSNKIDFSNTEISSPKSIASPSGGAVDLGVSVKLNDYMTLSLSVLDLGAMYWNNVTTAKTKCDPWTFEGFNQPTDDDTYSDQWEVMMDDLSDCFTMYVDQINDNGGNFLTPTVMAGFEYIIPGFDKLSFGVLGTAKLDKVGGYYEGRVSANLALGRVLSLSASAAESTFGMALGGVINFHWKGTSLFVGTDNYLPAFNVSSQYVPIKSLTTMLTFGTNINFGNYRGRYPKHRHNTQSETDI